jgi:hypothetical protein
MTYFFIFSIIFIYWFIIYETYYSGYYFVKNKEYRQRYYNILNEYLKTNEEINLYVDLVKVERRLFTHCLLYKFDVFFQNKTMEIEYSFDMTNLVFRNDYIKFSEKNKNDFENLIFTLKLFA